MDKKLIVWILMFFVAIFLLFLTFKPNTSKNTEKIFCEDSQRNVDACIEIYQPVCGYVQIECITAPCNPVPETFSNNCFACSNSRVTYYTEGECDEKP